jgi:hypothetical protein
MIEFSPLPEQEIPGCFKFSKRPLQNEDELRIMFGSITNDEADHWNPMSDNPIIPPLKRFMISLMILMLSMRKQMMVV